MIDPEVRSSWILLEGKPEETDRIKLCKGRPSWWRQGICSAAERSMCVFPRLSMSFLWSQCFSTCSNATITYYNYIQLLSWSPSSVGWRRMYCSYSVTWTRFACLGHFWDILGTWESWENRIQPTGHDWSIVRSPNLWRIFDPWDLAKQILTEVPCFRHAFGDVEKRWKRWKRMKQGMKYEEILKKYEEMHRT